VSGWPRAGTTSWTCRITLLSTGGSTASSLRGPSFNRFLGPQQGCQMVYFQTKIPSRVNIAESCNERCWYIVGPFGQFYGYLVYFVVICYIMWLSGIFFAVLVCCTKKNLATLVHIGTARGQGCQIFMVQCTKMGGNTCTK
jgi:hypothetical protein